VRKNEKNPCGETHVPIEESEIPLKSSHVLQSATFSIVLHVISGSYGHARYWRMGQVSDDKEYGCQSAQSSSIWIRSVLRFDQGQLMIFEVIGNGSMMFAGLAN
jgi:hypothetical protein